MKLITTIQEIKAITANSFVSDVSIIKPYITTAEEELRDKYLDDAQFASLVAYYNEGSPDAAELKLNQLLIYAQRFITNKAFAEYAPLGNVDISESGIHINSTDTKKAAFDWQVKALIKSFDKQAYAALESMIIFLEKNIETFTDWAESEIYQSISGLLISTATEFSKHYNINDSRLKFIAMLPQIQQSQTLIIAPAISQDYFDELIDKKLDGDLTTDDKTLLNILKPALANSAAALYLINDKESSSAHIAECEKLGNFYLDKAIKHLQKNASATKYPTFFASDLYNSEAKQSGNSTFENKKDLGIYVT